MFQFLQAHENPAGSHFRGVFTLSGVELKRVVLISIQTLVQCHQRLPDLGFLLPALLFDL